MVRLSKQERRRSISRRRPQPPAAKTGRLKDHLPKGFKEHANALDGAHAQKMFIPKIG